MSERQPLEGFTYEMSGDGDGVYIYAPDGVKYHTWNRQLMVRHGWQPPRPPRVGPCGMTEEETRLVTTWHHFDSPLTPAGTASNKVIAVARAAVAEWDAEDNA